MPTRPPKAYPNGQKPTPQPRVRRPSPHQSLYDSPEWKRASKAFRALHPWCQCEEHQGKIGSPRSECVDHTVRHGGDRVLFFDQRNWRALSWRCHTSKTNRTDGGFGNRRAKSSNANHLQASQAVSSAVDTHRTRP